MSFQKVRHKKLKASSMYYALFLSVIMGILLGGAVLLSSMQQSLLQQIEIEDKLYHNANSGINYALANSLEFIPGVEKSISLFDGFTDSVSIKKEYWGAYVLIHSTAKHGNKFFQQHVLAGQKIDYSLPNLFVPDYGRPISVCGETELNGTIATAESGFKRAYIEGKNFTGSAYYRGKKINSSRNLPSYNKHLLSLSNQIQGEFLPWDKNLDSINISFSQPALHYLSDNFISLNQIYVNGHVIIESSDSIFVAATAQLKDVILKSPIIHFESGFKGTVQCFAESKITVSTDCLLSYPSALALVESNFNDEISGSISLNERSQIIGSIYCISEKNDFRNPVEVLLAPNSAVDGIIYCTGRTQFQGTINGHLFTDKLYLKTAASTYENYLLDAVLTNQLPSEFVTVNLFEQSENLVTLSCVQ